MSRFLIGVLVVFIVAIVAVISSYNGIIRMQENIQALNNKSENTLSNYTNKVAEVAQVPSKYKEDLKEVIRENFQGRYGSDGSTATMQWFKENNINLDSKLYLNIQNVIISGRDEFKISQDRIQNLCATYNGSIRSFPKNIIVSMFDMKSNLKEDACYVVSDSRTREVFQTKDQKPLEIF
ncbi:hypothetical protein [Proteus mirabilis]|uniref:hypothetical protein n=1 Tax=Proteus mirabilis TaxID=584 RepID=UPI0034D48B56